MACAYCLSFEKNKTCYSRSININWIYYNLLSSKAHYSVLLTTEMYKGQTEHVSHVQHFALLFKSIRASIKAKTKNTWRLKTFRSIETNWNIFLTNTGKKHEKKNFRTFQSKDGQHSVFLLIVPSAARFFQLRRLYLSSRTAATSKNTGSWQQAGPIWCSKRTENSFPKGETSGMAI